jgi:hypothetical protein
MSGPVFATPWEARLFALVEGAIDAGLVTRAGFADRYGAALAADACAEQGEVRLAVLEALLVEAGVADAGVLDGLAEAWIEAAESTPHGQPIEAPKVPLQPPKGP